MADTAGDKTEEATDKRKREARSQGQVARSVDLSHALGMLALVATLPWVLSSFATGAMRILGLSFRNATPDTTPESAVLALSAAIYPMLPGLAALLAVACLVAVATNTVQFGLLWAPKAVAPSFAKINPLAGMKRIFSKSSLVEGIKAVFKTVIFGWMVYAAVTNDLVILSRLAELPTAEALKATGELTKTVILRLVGAWIALAALDFFFQKQNMKKGMMMSKDEVRQEMKEMEGSPEVKAMRMQKQRELSRKRTRDAVKTADVIITNPTHFSIALKYDPKKDHAPMVVAKGQDFLALKIREIAKEFNVPIVPNPPLARTLYKKCEVGDFVPRELFQAVAEVLAFVYRTIKMVR